MKILSLILASASLLNAQSTISRTDRYTYAGNAGWINFRPSVTNGVRITETYLDGYSYAANFGWISLGGGVPDNGHTYSNNSATDYGINMTSSGQLTGFAYSANVGWINFEQDKGKPRLDFTTGKLTGFVYSANVGWISLDTVTSDLITSTLANPDTDNDGISDAYEMQYFGNLTTANANTNFDGDGHSDAEEYIAGTIPNDPNSFFNITNSSHAVGVTSSTVIFTLKFTSTPNRYYTAQYNNDLQSPWIDMEWTSLTSESGTTSTGSVEVPASNSGVFFRVFASPHLKPLIQFSHDKQNHVPPPL